MSTEKGLREKLKKLKNEHKNVEKLLKEKNSSVSFDLLTKIEEAICWTEHDLEIIEKEKKLFTFNKW